MSRGGIHYLHTGPWPWYIGFTTDESAFQREMKRLRVKDARPGVKAGSNAGTHHFVNGSTNMVVSQFELTAATHADDASAYGGFGTAYRSASELLVG